MVNWMQKMLVFVAFGDSLTVGFQYPTPFSLWIEETPYTDFLQAKVEDLLGRLGQSVSFDIHFYNKGINGDLTSNMLLRFKRDVIELKPKPNSVIVLGGSNDIGWEVPTEEIFNNLKKMYVHARDNAIEPIACTVPSVFGLDSYIPPRLELNRLLREYCVQNELTCVDLFRATSDPNTNRLLEEFSNDGLHLTTEGYQKIAETIHSEAIEKIINKLI